MSAPPAVPLLIVISAPSGAGKSTLCDRLRAAHPDLRYSISCTTRAPREGEADGRDYHFIPEAEFRRRIAAGEFLEHATVHGHLYGTPRTPVLEAMQAGRDVLMDIDVQGAAQIRSRMQAAPAEDPLRLGYFDIFVVPPSLAELRRRLEGRATDRPEVIERRLQKAGEEMARRGEYMHVVVNDRLDDAFAQLESAIASERARRKAP
jgi:guanylate kinase